MGYHNEVFPLAVGYGSANGMSHKTSIFAMDSGQEQRVGRWSIFRKVYDAQTGIRKPSDIATLRHFVAARRGALHSFPVHDEADHSTASDDVGVPAVDDQYLADGDGSNKIFQLRKRYGDASLGVYWTILKPVPGSVVVAVDGVTKTEGVDFSVNTGSGLVVFFSAPAANLAVTAGCEFYVPCRFTEDVDEEYLTSMEDVGVSSSDQILMIEEMSTSLIDDEYNYGGAAEVAISSGTHTPSLLQRVLTVTDATGDIVLPPPTNLPYGGPYLVFNNTDGVSLTVNDNNNNLVGTVAAGGTRTLYLALVSGQSLWLLV